MFDQGAVLAGSCKKKGGPVRSRPLHVSAEDYSGDAVSSSPSVVGAEAGSVGSVGSVGALASGGVMGSDVGAGGVASVGAGAAPSMAGAAWNWVAFQPTVTPGPFCSTPPETGTPRSWPSVPRTVSSWPAGVERAPSKVPNGAPSTLVTGAPGVSVKVCGCAGAAGAGGAAGGAIGSCGAAVAAGGAGGVCGAVLS